jgi:hypothetical protein
MYLSAFCLTKTFLAQNRYGPLTFSKYPRFLNVADSGSLFTNGYGLFSKNKDPRLFRNHILSLDNNIDVLVKVLNSSTMDYYVNKTSVSIAGGYPCYQKNFIEKFSIPDMNQVDVDMLRSLNSKTSIDNYVKNLYGLNVLSGNLV